jgi:hypothetical protein
MFVRALLIITFALMLIPLASSEARAQSAGVPPDPVEDQSEAFRDTFKRMQIKREEEEHKKLLEKAAQIKEMAGTLAKENHGRRLSSSSEKKLKEIEKAARHIRSESGGSDDNRQLDSPPGTLAEALKRLGTASERLQASIEKTSRHIVSAAVISEATEIIHLVKLIRNIAN